MATARELRHRTLADFLAWERDQPERHERLRSVIRMMTGGTVAHNRITRNCARALESSLRRGDCEVFTSDMKVVSPEEDVMYPDVVVVCSEISAKTTELENPIIVVEVLSESTAARDHSLKRWAYQMIPSLAHYVLIDQAKPVVEVASRNHDGSWRSLFYRGLEGKVRLNALDGEIDLADVFARVGFAPSETAGERAKPTSVDGEP